MNARQKINNLYLKMLIGTAGLIGIVCQSGFLFFLVIIIGLIYSLKNDAIRMESKGPSQRIHRHRRRS